MLLFCVQGWRWAWIISGIPGLLLAIVILVTIKEPPRKHGDASVALGSNGVINQLEGGWREKAATICLTFLQPSLLVLCFAGSVRNAGM